MALILTGIAVSYIITGIAVGAIFKVSVDDDTISYEAAYAALVWPIVVVGFVAMLLINRVANEIEKKL